MDVPANAIDMRYEYTKLMNAFSCFNFFPLVAARATAATDNVRMVRLPIVVRTLNISRYMINATH